MKYFYSDKRNIKKNIAGSKASNLSLLKRHHLLIPKTFFFTISSYKYFLEQNNIINRIESFVKDIYDKDNSGKELKRIRQKIIESPFPPKLLSALQDISEELIVLNINKLAIRSSAVFEDLPGFSFAGQYQTLLQVNNNVESIAAAIKEVWASQWTMELITYFIQNNLSLQTIGLGIIIQEQIEPDISGVLFTENPTNNNPNELLIEYVEGLGDKLVSGEKVPAQLIFNKAIKKFEPDLGPSDKNKHLLTELANESLHFCSLTGESGDFEWAIKDSQIYFLQYRPITTLKNIILWTDENVGEVIPDIVTPLTWSILEGVTNNSYSYFLTRLGLFLRKESVLFKTIKGKVYINKSAYEKTMAELYLMKKSAFAIKQKNILKFIRVFYEIITILIRLVVLVFFLPIQVKRFLKWHSTKSKSMGFKSKCPKYLLENIKLIKIIHQKNMNLHVTVSFLGEFFYQGLKKLGEQWKIFSDEISLDMLLQGSGQIESANSGIELWKLYKEISKNSTVLSEMKAINTEKIPELLKTKYPHLNEKYYRFLDKFGHNAIHEFELFYPRWNEDHQFIFNTIINYSNLPESYSAIDQNVKLMHEAQTSLVSIKKKLPLFKKIIFVFFFNKTKQLLAYRENLKQSFLRAHDVLKKNILQLSKNLQLKNVQDIFFLSLQEINDIIYSDLEKDLIDEKIAKAREVYHKNIDSYHPKAYTQIGEHFYKNEDDSSLPDSGTLKGIGCSAGKVKGIARIVTDPDKIDGFNKGDILIAKSTNPAWTPLFILAGGIATEIGGALSHASIIAREYGIPLVTAVPNLLQKIKDGMEVIVDGSNGFIRINEIER